jgi:enoyl-CoA hydratase
VRNGRYAQLIFDPKHRNDREVAESLTQLAPLTLAATKESIRRIQAARTPDRDEGEDLIPSCYISDDFRGAVRAFVERRKYTWIGR